MVPGEAEAEAAKAVLVIGEHIVAVAAAGELTAPTGALIIDGQGFTLMPGLIDAHIHLNDETELAGYLAHGVTGVRNMSGYPFHLKLIAQIELGALLGPDFITTGPILNSRGPNETVLQQTVTGYQDARAAVRQQYQRGYRALKLYSNLTKEAYQGIVDEAAELGISISGHSPEGVRTAGIPHDKPFDIDWQASLGRGFQTLEHIETIVWHSLRDDLNEARMRQVAAQLAKSGEVVTPTLIAHKRRLRIAHSKGAYLARPGSEAINPLVRFYAKDAEQFWSRMEPSHYEQPHADFFLIATRLLHEAGVPLIAGSDSGGFGLIPGASLADELELLVTAGLSPFEVLTSATRLSAMALGFEKTGMITPGFRANLLLIPTDPLQHIGAVKQPAGVMIGGHWLDEAALAAMKDAAKDNALNRTFNRSLWRFVEMKAQRL
ncbi:amidohydrolase family protein [Alkalimonas sp. NCh-2]|uniref:amidohydrolase family protein n=1 Tax=Alkalimonas sp. NCh-2 TaxID=3144846 RepID=UPI0031F6A7BA